MTREEAQAVIMNEQKCIDRADRCNRDCGNCDLVMDEKIINEVYNFAIKALEQTKRKSGKWYKPVGMMPPEYAGVYRCSKCDEVAMRDWKHHKQVLSNFCPNCGADMREGQDEQRK